MGIYTGGTGNDVITPFFVSPGVVRTPIGSAPTADSDIIAGGDGNDSIDGGGGADAVSGGAGNDTLVAFIGGSYRGEDDDDLFLVVSAGAGTTLIGGRGLDTLNPSGPLDLTEATVIGFDVLALDASPLTLTAGQLNDFIRIIADGTPVAATINLSAGGSASVAVTALPVLTVNGSAGNDTLHLYRDASAAIASRILVDAGLGDDSITTDFGEDTLNGGAGNDTLDGSGGIDLLDGGDGNDRLSVGDGDRAYGGNDDDRFAIGWAYGPATTIDGGDGVDSLMLWAPAVLGALVTITSIENLLLDSRPLTLSTAQLESFTRIGRDLGPTGILVLSAGGTATTEVGGLETLIVTGSAETEVLTFTQPGTIPTAITVNAGGGNDSITTGNGADSLDGGDGNDVLRSGAGNDTLSGQGGDTLSAGDGDDLITLSGNLSLATSISGGAGIDTLDPIGAAVLGALVTIRGVENLALDASPLALSTAQLDGFTRIGPAGATAGTIILSSGGSAKTEVGGLQTLSVTGSSGNEDLTFTQPGTTPTAITVNAGFGDDTITTGNGADHLDGSDGNDVLKGGAGNDILAGGAGADTLNGGDGRDLIIGGTGADRMRGGGGADVFRYDIADGSLDIIADFTRGVDLLRIDASGFGGALVAGPLAPDRLVVHASDSATAPAGTGQFVFNTATAQLLWDPDGSGAKLVEAIARLVGVTTLSASDFDIIA